MNLTIFRGCIGALLLATALPAIPAAASGASPAELVAALRGGGHVIYIRHASTETDYADQVNADPTNCATQRVLSEEGWHEARRIGRAFDRLGIPVGTVRASQYCRAWKTADLAFGRYEQDPALNFEPAETYSEAQIARMRGNVVPHLSARPPFGTNTVIVGHDDPFEAATGIYPEPMGVAWVIRPSGDGFELLGQIHPQDWNALP